MRQKRHLRAGRRGRGLTGAALLAMAAGLAPAPPATAERAPGAAWGGTLGGAMRPDSGGVAGAGPATVSPPVADAQLAGELADEAALAHWAMALGRADRCAGSHRISWLADAAEAHAARAYPGLRARFDGRRSAHGDALIRQMVAAYIAGARKGCPPGQSGAVSAGPIMPGAARAGFSPLPAGGSEGND